GPPPDDAGIPLHVCGRYTELLWLGQAVTVPASFARPPTTDTILTLDKRGQDTAIASLREACEDRRGKPDTFPADLASLAGAARGFGESPEAVPWRADGHTGAPLEDARFEEAATYGAWARHLVSHETTCRSLGMPEARCEKCATVPAGTLYD